MRPDLTLIRGFGVVVIGTAAALCAGCSPAAVPTSVYLSVFNAPGAATPTDVQIDIQAPDEDGGAGALLNTSTHRVEMSAGGALGTVTIYPSTAVSALHIVGRGLANGTPVSSGNVDVTLDVGHQVSARLTLGSDTIGDGGTDGAREAGTDGARDVVAEGASEGGADVIMDAPAPPEAGAGGAGGSDGSRAEAGPDVVVGDASHPDAASPDGTVADASQPDVAPSPTIISIDFVGTGTAMAASETAGVVKAGRWNSAAGATGTLASLAAADGTTTSASATWNGGGTTRIFKLSIADAPGDARMMIGYLDPWNAEMATVTVSGLPEPMATNGYDLYVYANADVGNETRVYNYAVGTVSMQETQNSGQNFAGTYTLAAGGGMGNYVLFQNLKGASVTLTATPGPATTFQRCPVNGIQIVGR